jgi:hypothetical protein
VISAIEARDDLPAPRLQQTQRLWLPGDFPSSNAMLEHARAEGFNAGLRHYERSRGKRQSAIHRPHARIIASIRAHAAAHGRKYLHQVPPEHWVRLAFFLIGHPRYDADAWYLAAKPIADGLQDAGIIGRDGADVHSTEGRCVRSAEEARALLMATLDGVPGYPYAAGPPPAGMLVEVSPWG